MPFYDFFRTLFGIPNQQNDIFNQGPNNEEPRDRNEYRNNFWGRSGESHENIWRDSYEEGSPESEENIGFNIFTDPLEMHRYFEQQMNEVLKSFNGFFGQDSGAFFGNMPPEDFQQQEPSKRSLRDQLLKPGYENARDHGTHSNNREDGDLDGRISAADFDELLTNKQMPLQQMPSSENRIIPQIRSFGQSMSSKTIRRPDGTIETHRTTVDSVGNEENIITKQVGDKQYTVTIRTDKDGKQEKQEEMINIEENELSRFTGNSSRKPTPENDPNFDPNQCFPYDKFFK